MTRGLLALLLALPAFAAPSPLPNGRYTIGRCETHVYDVDLRAGETLRGAIDQEGVDVTITVTRAEDDFVVLKQNRREGHGGRERFLVLAARDGRYRFEVQANELSGAYALEPEPLHVTTADELLERAAESEITHTTPGSLFSGAPLVEIRTKLEAALRGCQIVGSYECEADALQSLAHARWYASEDVRGARDLLLASLVPRKRSPDRFAEGETYNDLGIITRWLGDLHEARDHFERVIPLKRVPGFETDPLVLMNSGPIYWQLGDLQKAIDTEKAALAIWRRRESEDPNGQAYVHNILGQFALQLGDTAEALRNATEARRLYLATSHWTGIVESTSRLGTVYDALGNRERALELYRDALALAAKIFDKQGEANALLHMGRTLTALDRPAEARRSLTKALEIVRASNRDETSVQLALGNSYMRSKSFSSAAESYRHVLALTEKSGDAAPRAEAQLALARIEMRRGRLRQALASLQAAQSIVETLRVRIANPEVRASYLTSRQAHYDLTIDVLMQLGRERDALDVSERARSRALLDALMIARVGDGRADPALLVREEAVRQRLNGKASALIRLQPKQRDGSEGRELRREIDALLAQYQQVRGDVARTEDDVNGRALPAKDIRSLLDADTLLIEYALGESRSYMWVVSRDSLDAFTLPPKADLDRLARRVIDLIPQSHKRDAAVQAEIASRRLSDALLRPAAHLLGKRRLAVVADGALQFVSFAALSDPSTPSQPLLVNHEIVALPSASLIAPLRRNRGRAVPQKIVAVLADPVLERGGTREVSTDLLRSSSPFANAFVRLPHTREEARRIAALVPSDQRMVAVDYDASRAVATSGQLENFRIVHFATHGFVHGEHPELSGLVLSLYDENGRSQDGFLRLSDIYRMRLSADLVVLSACRTALGKEVGREGLIGLTRGFISAGAPRVVASLWDVRDRATAELMERFYTHMLRDRMRPAAALRAAQLALQNDPRRSAPFYWAAFQLQGDWK